MHAPVLLLVTAFAASVAAAPLPVTPIESPVEALVTREADAALSPAQLDVLKRTIFERLEEIVPVKRDVPDGIGCVNRQPEGANAKRDNGRDPLAVVDPTIENAKREALRNRIKDEGTTDKRDAEEEDTEDDEIDESIEKRQRGSGVSESLERRQRGSGVSTSVERRQRGTDVSESLERRQRGSGVSTTVEKRQRGSGVSTSVERRQRGSGVSEGLERRQRGSGVSESLERRQRGSGVSEGLERRQRGSVVSETQE